MPREAVKSEVEPSYRTPRFHDVGDSFTGILLKKQVTRQKTKFGTQDKEFWDEEKTRPRMEHLYTFLMVDESHAYNPKSCFYCKKIKVREGDDNGGRIIYASDKQHYAIQRAISKVAKPEMPGWVKLTYAGDDDAKKKDGFEAPKLWVAEYRICTDEEVDQADEFTGYVPGEVQTDEEKQDFDALLYDEPQVSSADSKKMSLEDIANYS